MASEQRGRVRAKNARDIGWTCAHGCGRSKWFLGTLTPFLFALALLPDNAMHPPRLIVARE